MSKLALFGGKKIRRKPFVSRAIVGKEESKRVNSVLKSGILSGFIAKSGDGFLGGKEVREFESLVGGYFGTEHVISVNSATAGLHVALGACGIGPGDEVIVTPYTMSASATAIIMQNAIPVFADISENTFCIDPGSIEQCITARTKAIIVVHLFGHPAEMNRIKALARKYKLKIIEDCAQAPGAVYKKQLVGTLGDIGIFSLNQHKTVTSGEGGFAITRNARLALGMRLIRNHGEVIAGNIRLKDISNIVGYNYRMTELEAAVSIGQFRRLDFLNAHRINLARYLTEKLSKFEGLTLPAEESGTKHVYFVYPIRIKESEARIPRDVFVKALNAEGIPCAAGYVRPIYLEPLYQKKIAYGRKGCPFTCGFYKGNAVYSKGICPVAEKMHRKELVIIPVCRYPETPRDMDDVVKAFQKIFNNRDKLRKFQ
ncbi:MAG: DegT/DnrJ/EryC1/StrS family aminotransferase [Candidatus Omnitrophica bacterium]|nr:DegT/DnrJ/EryC1/StrS family aminotransferase [Candidatus Omnitrophota bacterium]